MNRWIRYVFIITLLPCGCRSESSPERPASPAESASMQLSITNDGNAGTQSVAEEPVASSRIRLTDIAGQTGLDHVYQNGATGKLMMVEGFGGGVGALDFDNDGNWDLLFSQGGDPAAHRAPSQPPVKLFRNLPPAESNRQFIDVAAQAGLGRFGYGQGVAVGDYNADGFDDVYLTSVGTNVLLKNMGDGTFRDVTEASGTEDGSQWSSSAAFADLTGDGHLDLYVCNYLEYDPKHPIDCRGPNGEPRICQPRETPPLADACFVSLGDGSFRDQAQQRGLVAEGSKSLGVAIADFDVNGAPDVYVANDTTSNFLFMNDGASQFQDRALLYGCAVNFEGLCQAGMGLAVNDYNSDGLLDIYVTHYFEESNTLYRNLGVTGFLDVTSRLGLHRPTMQSLGFGVVMSDLDQNGLADLLITNGHVEYYPENPVLEMTPQVFQFDGDRWQEVSGWCGEFFERKLVGRGIAAIDVDNDGDLDAAVVHQNQPAALLRNDSQRGHWLKLTLVGLASPRRGIGARVTVTAGQQEYVQEMVGGSSYQSTHQPMLIFGLGEHTDPCRVKIRWPSGIDQVLEGVDVDQELVVFEQAS